MARGWRCGKGIGVDENSDEEKASTKSDEEKAKEEDSKAGILMVDFVREGRRRQSRSELGNYAKMKYF